MTEQSITPLPGKTLVRLEGLISNTDAGSLILPSSSDRTTYVADVLVTNMTDKDRAFLGVDTLDGARLIVIPEAGTWVGDDRWLFPNLICINTDDVKTKNSRPKYESPFLAIAAKKALISVAEAVPRCKYCGPARAISGPNNMILVPMVDKDKGEMLGCPRCNKDRTGRQINKKYTKDSLDRHSG